MRYPVINNFQVQRKAIESRLTKPTPAPDVPRLTKGLTVPQWAALFRVFLTIYSSTQGCATMVYVSLKDKAVVNPAPVPVLVVNQPHYIEHGLVAEDYRHCPLHADAH